MFFVIFSLFEVLLVAVEITFCSLRIWINGIPAILCMLVHVFDLKAPMYILKTVLCKESIICKFVCLALWNEKDPNSILERIKTLIFVLEIWSELPKRCEL